jgi:hypothetical protein
MSALSEQGLRIRLEGRVETLEVALATYHRLEALLRGDWRGAIIEQRAFIDQLIAQEPAVNEALGQVRKTAQHEGWAADALPRRLVDRVEEQRADLRFRLLSRLKKVSPEGGAPTWPAALARLQQLATQVRLPGPGEPVVLRGTATRAMPLWVMALIPTLLAGAFFGGMAGAGVGASMICLGLAVLPLGEFTLLADRLVWIPHRGEPFHLELGALQTTLTAAGGLVIDGPRRLTLPLTAAPAGLAALLALYGKGPLKGCSAPPSGTALILAAHAQLDFRQALVGTALLHSEGLVFLPQGSGPALLHKLTGVEGPVSEEFLLRQLSRLPAAQLNPALAAANGLPRGLCCGKAQVRAEAAKGSVRLTIGRVQLTIDLRAAELEAVRSLMPWAWN